MSSNASSGTLPSGWVRKTLGDVCSKPQYGWTTSASLEGRVKLLRTTDLTHGPIDWASVPYCKEVPKDVEKYLVAPGDIFISRAGSVGVSVLIEAVEALSVFASYLIRIRHNETVTSSFVKLFLESPSYWEQIAGASSGIALANINGTKIKKIHIPVPPIEEQIKILEILEKQFSRLDAALVSVRAVREKAARFRRSLLHTAFIGALTGHDTSTGKLPDGWIQSELGKVAKWGSGGTPKSGTPSFYGGAIPWAVIGDLTETWVNKTAKTITQAGLKKSSAKIIEPGTVMLAMYGASIGRTGIAAVNMATNQAIAFAVPVGGVIDNQFLLKYLQLQKEKFVRAGQGGAQPNIGQTVIKPWPIPLPPLSEQIEIVEILDEQLSRLDASLAVADVIEKKASAMRRSLLHAAFTGQLTKEWREGADV